LKKKWKLETETGTTVEQKMEMDLHLLNSTEEEKYLFFKPNRKYNK